MARAPLLRPGLAPTSSPTPAYKVLQPRVCPLAHSMAFLLGSTLGCSEPRLKAAVIHVPPWPGGGLPEPPTRGCLSGSAPHQSPWSSAAGRHPLHLAATLGSSSSVTPAASLSPRAIEPHIRALLCSKPTLGSAPASRKPYPGSPRAARAPVVGGRAFWAEALRVPACHHSSHGPWPWAEPVGMARA